MLSRRSRSLLLLALPVALLPLRHGSGASGGRAGPELSSAEWLAGAARRVAEWEYRATRNGVGLQAPNRAHGLRTYFEPTGIRVVDRTAEGSPELCALRLSGLGRGTRIEPVAPGELTSEGARVEIRREALIEWYANSAVGLEQGFTLASPPEGAGPVVLEIDLSEARATQQRDSVRISTATGRSLTYGELAAKDASGNAIPIRIAVSSMQRLQLRVEDAGSIYPITIDPLLTSTWDAELAAGQSLAALGTSVAGAGDVNGDGYADVIVGAPGYDAGEVDESAAFIFLGSATGIADGNPGTAQSRLEGGQVGAAFGASVAGAGDVNGDGYADVIVGAPAYDAGEADEGAAFVFLGGAAGIPNASATSAQARLESDQSSANFGASVAGAGDLNGDGYADVIVGAPAYDAGEADEGAAFVFLGGAAGIADTHAAGAHARLESDQPGAGLGTSVAGAGDVNGDGFDDVVVGAPGFESGLSKQGAAFVFHGGAAGIAGGGPGDAAARIDGDLIFAELGRAVAGAGDVNGDGYSDVIVGAPRDTAGELFEGAAFVFHGGPAGITGGSAAAANAWIQGDEWVGQFGASVAGAGDVNGDGYADVIVGGSLYDAPGQDSGAAFVFLGTAGGITGSSATVAYAKLSVSQSGAHFGTAVAGAGDVNGDGYADVIAGAPAYGAGEDGEGEAFVYLGGPSPLPDWGLSAAAGRFESGWSGPLTVSGAGDVNGDGYADVIIGSLDYDTGQASAGAAFIFHGGPGRMGNMMPAEADTYLASDQPDSSFGSLVEAAGDVNGDGYADVIVTAPRYDAGQTDEGAVFIFHGSASGVPTGTTATAATRLESDQAYVNLGTAAGAGDVNGDGYADVIVGSIRYFYGAPDTGAAFVFLGSPSGIASGSVGTASARLDGDRFMGWSVAGAGDVNGDGYADVIVGAPYHGASGQIFEEGAAYIFLGSPAGIASGNPGTATARLESDQRQAHLGWSVAAAGDVNGDGYADVIVGAPGYDHNNLSYGTQWNDGAAFIFLGGASGISDGNPATAATRLEGDLVINGNFGSSVAGAGDVNGDGYADVLVSAPPSSGSQESVASGVYVFLGSAQGVADAGRATAATAIHDDRGEWVGTYLYATGVGDVNGDGYADVICGARGEALPYYEDRSAAFLVLGGVEGRPARTRQLRGDGSGVPVQPRGTAHGNGFEIEMVATHSEGRGQVKLEVEACPLAVGFGDVRCTTRLGTTWNPAPGSGVLVSQALTDLVPDTLYRWRARVLRAPIGVTLPGITPPPNPAHGPWRRLSGRADEADIRTIPEPDAVIALIAGASLLGLLYRRRLARG
jgi:hypothetical protein